MSSYMKTVFCKSWNGFVQFCAGLSGLKWAGYFCAIIKESKYQNLMADVGLLHNPVNHMR